MSFGQGDVDVAARILAAGYELPVIYDIGASNGSWTATMRPVLPEAHIELFEPLGEVEPHYKAGLDHVRANDPRAVVNVVAVGGAEGEATMRMFPDPVGSTALGGGWGAEPLLRAPQVTIDSLVAAGKPVPTLIKADTQGSELAILHGAERILPMVGFLLLETWIVRGYGEATPLFSEIVQHLHPRGFVPYDFGDAYREDGANVAQDVWFINVRQSRGKPWFYVNVPTP